VSFATITLCVASQRVFIIIIVVVVVVVVVVVISLRFSPETFGYTRIDEILSFMMNVT
jgi:hypothetical protein